MSNKLQRIQKLARDEAVKISGSPRKYMDFLSTAGQNYKYSYLDQLLIHVQRPETIACADMATWNKLGRWVNRGAKGIALLPADPAEHKLRYVFTYTDTNSRAGSEVHIWEFNRDYESQAGEALENSFGIEAEYLAFPSFLIAVSETVAVDNLADYLSELDSVKAGSLIEEMDADNIKTVLKYLIRNSVAYIALTRCGFDAEDYFDTADFENINLLNTPQTMGVLGEASGDISRMILREIESTVKSIEKEQLRILAKNKSSDYYVGEDKNIERSYENGTDIHTGGRLSAAESGGSGSTEAGQIRDAAPELSEGAPEGSLHGPLSGGNTEPSSGGNRFSGRADDGRDSHEDESIAGSERDTEGAESDEVGSDDEQHKSGSGGNRSEGADLQLIPKLPSPEEQQDMIAEAEAKNASAFTISMEEVDDILRRGSGFSKGKYRIYEQYLKGENVNTNAAFLKKEYGVGGTYPAIPDTKIDLNYDGKGIRISKGALMKPAAKTTLSWPMAAKRIKTLIDTDRYMNNAEKEYFRIYLKEEELRAERDKVSQEFRSIIYEFNRFLDDTGEKEKQLNLWLMSGCWTAFSVGEKKTFTRDVGGEFILPIMRDTMNLIIAESTYLTRRCEDMLNVLSSELSKPLEPTYDELNPPPPPKTEYRFSLGDEVYIGTGKYEILSMSDDTVVLFDSAFPLFNKEMPREEFDSKAEENPFNDKYRVIVEEDNRLEENQDLAQAKKLIEEYCYDEFDSPPDFSDLSAVDVAYTTSETKEFSILATVDLEHFRIDGYLDHNLVRRWQFNSLNDLIHEELERLDFNDLVSIDEDAKPLVAMVEYLGSDGNVGYSTQYSDPDKLESDIARDIENGVPLSLVIYRDANGRTIPLDFLKKLDPPPKGLRYEDLNGTVFDLNAEAAVSESIPDASAVTKAFETAGYKAETSYNGKIIFEDAGGYPLTFNDWDTAYRFIDDAKLISAPETVRERVKKTLHPELYEKLVPPAPVKKHADSFMLNPEISSESRINYRISDDELGVGTPGQRYAKNIAAIKLLKQLESENRLATADEQETLSSYVGWGGLSECFEDTNSHYGELKNLLTADEYEAARESTLSAFYTPPVVIRSMYSALENMGFKTGNILEPSCGVGNFLGMLPESMADSKLYGVELDSISGRIAQQLYQKSSIAVQGYEKTDLPDSFFDCAIGNVPFGQFKIADKRYDKNNFLVHDYFFARTLDKVRPGGVIAFITSKGTLDKENPSVRKYIAQRADLIGAIRLPNNTFKSAAGTEVTSDIIFLQKRERLTNIEPEWVHLGISGEGFPINQYFVDNPDMVLGEMREVSGPYGPETACIAYDNRELSDLLNEAVQNIHAGPIEYETRPDLEMSEDLSVLADPSVRNFSYTLVEDKIYYRENSRMNPVDVSATAESRIKGMIQLRDCARKLIELQTEDYPSDDIEAEQLKLNSLYDDFSSKYGLINSRANNSAFRSDSSYCLLSSLEVLDNEGKFLRKADMFSKRTIRPHIEIKSVDTASEALAVSLGERAFVDMDYMCELTGKSEQDISEDLKGVIFLNPLYGYGDSSERKYLPADEYLSGNVREKLRTAEKSADLYPEDYTVNVDALKQVQPKDLTPGEISVRLGATWIPPEIIEQFVFELMGTPVYARWNIHVHFSEYSGDWQVEGKSYDRGNIKAYSVYGTERANGYKIIEDSLNLKDVRVYDYIVDADGKKTQVLNKNETAVAQGKQELIKQAFEDWIWKAPERRNALVKLYNERFNSVRPREYDGSHLIFVGMNPEIQLRQHQLNAVAHIIYGGNTLLAHVVGAGKSATRS